MSNLNVVNITGNLTRKPELQLLGMDGGYVCKLRVAVSGRRRNRAGFWVDRTNQFDVSVWGQGAIDATYGLARGRGVAITGRLERREWTDDAGVHREVVEIHTDSVEFLDTAGHGEEVEM